MSGAQGAHRSAEQLPDIPGGRENLGQGRAGQGRGTASGHRHCLSLGQGRKISAGLAEMNPVSGWPGEAGEGLGADVLSMPIPQLRGTRPPIPHSPTHWFHW